MKTEEDLKKYFLSIGLSLKFKFADKIKNSHISISDLFDKAIEQQIPITDWQIFIYDQMNIEDYL